MKKSYPTLTPQDVRLGAIVLCIKEPNVSIFEYADLLGYEFVSFLPRVGVRYTVRCYSLLEVDGQRYRGIHLKEIHNPSVFVMGDPRGEPFFELGAFTLVSSRSP